MSVDTGSIVDLGVKPIMAGVVAALLLGMFEGFDSITPIFGYNIPTPLVAGVLVGTSTALSEGAKNLLLPYLPLDRLTVAGLNLADPLIAGSLLAGFSMITMEGYNISDIPGSLILGGGSLIVGDYLSNAIKPIVQGTEPLLTLS